MNITIEEISTRNIKDMNRYDGEFIIDSKLTLRLENDEILYSVISLPATKKRYDVDDADYTAYIDKDDKVVFLAYVDGQIAGQIILRKNLNRYAYVEDISVDVRFRRRGIGAQLISKAKGWAEKHRLNGIMLETQNNNVSACKFYESCGFHLGGFDTHLYKGLDPQTDEIALYWYWLFIEEPRHRHI
jgi:streptothricin acetyltransferase